MATLTNYTQGNVHNMCYVNSLVCKQSPRNAHSRGSMGLWCVAWIDQSYIYKFLASLGGSL